MALLLTGVWYGASTWTALTNTETARLHTIVMATYRYMYPANLYNNKFLLQTDLEILDKIQLPLPINYLKILSFLPLQNLSQLS